MCWNKVILKKKKENTKQPCFQHQILLLSCLMLSWPMTSFSSVFSSRSSFHPVHTNRNAIKWRSAALCVKPFHGVASRSAGLLGGTVWAIKSNLCLIVSNCQPIHSRLMKLPPKSPPLLSINTVLHQAEQLWLFASVSGRVAKCFLSYLSIYLSSITRWLTSSSDSEEELLEESELDEEEEDEECLTKTQWKQGSLDLRLFTCFCKLEQYSNSIQ